MRRSLSRVLGWLVNVVASLYRPPARCEVCKWTAAYHAPDCPVRLESYTTVEQWRGYAAQKYEQCKDAQERTRKAWRRAHEWEGKFHILRRENNALRKRLRPHDSNPTPAPAPEPESAATGGTE